MQRLREDIKTGKFNRLYVLCGDDDYSIGVYKNMLKNVVMPVDDGMNMIEFKGKGQNVNSIIDTARTIPFLAERRVVIVTNSELLCPPSKKKSSDDDEEDSQDETSDEVASDGKEKKSKKEKEYGLAEFFAEIPETTVMIFCEEHVDRRAKIFKAAMQYGYVATFNKISEKDDQGISRIWGYVASRLRKDNLQMTTGAWNLLIKRTGTDLRNVFTEVEKLTCYALDKGTITTEDVELLVPERIEDKIFVMTEYMTNFKQKEALDLYYDLLRIKEEKPVKIMAMIYRQYHQMYIVKKLSSEGINEKEVMKLAGINERNSFQYGKLLRFAGRYTYDELKKAMKMCLDYDKAYRTGKIKDNVAVEMVIVAMSSRQPTD